LSKESLLHATLPSHEHWQIKQQISALKQLKTFIFETSRLDKYTYLFYLKCI